jgi:hypothetical protein
MIQFQSKANKLRLGYVPGVIRHHFHGSKKNRKYTDRWKILMKHDYSPIKDLVYDEQGILIAQISNEFKQDIMNYFMERKEDNDE